MEERDIDPRWIKVHAFRQQDRFGVALYIIADIPVENGPSQQYYLTTTGFKHRSPGAIMPPLVEMEENAAQALMDRLWDTGIRPTETRTHTLGIEAMKNHLNDLRKITFFLLKGDKEAKDSLII